MQQPIHIQALFGHKDQIGSATAATIEEAFGCIKAFMSMDTSFSLVVDRGFVNFRWRRESRDKQEAYEERRARQGRDRDYDREEEEEIDSEEVRRRVQGYRRPREEDEFDNEEEDEEHDDEENVPDITAEGGMFGDAVTGHDDDDEEEDDDDEEEEDEESEAKGPPPPPPIVRPPPKKKPAKRMSEPIPDVAVASDAQKKTEETTTKHVPQTFAEVDQQVRRMCLSVCCGLFLFFFFSLSLSLSLQEQLAKTVAEEERKQVAIDIQEAVTDNPQLGRPLKKVKRKKKKAASAPPPPVQAPLKPILKQPIPPAVKAASAAAHKKRKEQQLAEPPVANKLVAERAAKVKKLREEYDALVRNPNEDPSCSQRRSTLLLIRDTVMEQMESAVVGSDEYNRYSQAVDNVMQMLQALPAM